MKLREYIQTTLSPPLLLRIAKLTDSRRQPIDTPPPIIHELSARRTPLVARRIIEAPRPKIPEIFAQHLYFAA